MCEKQDIDNIHEKHAIDSPWFIQDAFRINHVHKRQLTLVDFDKNEYKVDIKYLGTNKFGIKMAEDDDS